MKPEELLNLGITFASALGGAFAAWAAWRSAGHAKAAQDSADLAERRAVLREISSAASSVLVEQSRIANRADELKLSYRNLFALSGASSSSNLTLLIARIDEKLKAVEALAADAKLFSNNAVALVKAPPEEHDRVITRMRESLIKMQGCREDLEREHNQVESQCAERRESMARTRAAR